MGAVQLNIRHIGYNHLKWGNTARHSIQCGAIKLLPQIHKKSTFFSSRLPLLSDSVYYRTKPNTVISNAAQSCCTPDLISISACATA